MCEKWNSVRGKILITTRALLKKLLLSLWYFLLETQYTMLVSLPSPLSPLLSNRTSWPAGLTAARRRGLLLRPRIFKSIRRTGWTRVAHVLGEPLWWAGPGHGTSAGARTPQTQAEDRGEACWHEQVLVRWHHPQRGGGARWVRHYSFFMSLFPNYILQSSDTWTISGPS